MIFTNKHDNNGKFTITIHFLVNEQRIGQN